MHRIPVVLLLLTGCSSSVTDAALKVTVHFGNTPSKCAQLNVTGKDNKLSTSSPLVKGSKDLLVGVLETPDLGSTVDVQAIGFAADDCTGGKNDQSSVFHETFKKGQVDTVTLSLDGMGGGGGGGGSMGGGVGGGGSMGGGAGGGGGTTCLNCGAGCNCEDGGVGHETNCADTADNDGDALRDCFDPDCDGKFCGTNKACVNFTCVISNVESDCSDGVDNNNDGHTDCDDPTCSSRACNDGNVCTLTDVCNGTSCGGTAFTCTQPNECQAPNSGSCLADGGCSYTAMAGPCDGGSCNSGQCVSVGFGYTPSNFDSHLPTQFIVPPVTLDCGVTTFDSTFGTWTNWCHANQPKPPMDDVFRAMDNNLAVIAMEGLNIASGSTLKVTGLRPVAIAVYGDATIDGVLTASSDHESAGAGAPAAKCFAGNHNGGDGHAFTQAGGGGGALAKNGAKGGDGNGSSTAGNGGASWGMSPDDLNGGCSGGDGAVFFGSVQTAAKGGAGGGGLQLSASGNLTINGKVSANGGGGRAPAAGSKSGGGGGGAGGDIVLEANLLTIAATAQLTAQAGAGGSGSTDDGGDGTQDGENGHDVDGDKSQGGQTQNPGGNGGDGSSLNDTSPTSGDDAQSMNGGGGGGGAGYGRIFLRSIATCSLSSSALVAPAQVSASTCP
ncbi:MAG: hypothetical protein QM723_24345 [Myxococcaceae bacterium]